MSTAKNNANIDQSSALVKRVWSFCNVLRDEGVGASDYLEQITFLLFLKMADELDRDMPAEWNWKILASKSGSDLKDYYEKLLSALGKEPGMLGQMFLQAKNHINTPARLSGLIDMIGRETWSGLNTDLKGNIYEELLAKTAEDKKSGAGQYFTARALISVIMSCVRPQPGETICDPACGTGGFFLKAYEYILENYADKMNVKQKRFLKNETFSGNEIVATTRRLCLMNMYLHNMGELDGNVPVELKDALVSSPAKLVKIVTTNPPFGKKTAQTVINDDGEESKEKQLYNRQDFWCETSNKQLNFIQHIRTLLRTDGRAAVVLPDNVLFEKGAGETIRRKLMETMDLHTILRLPTGIFYAQGVRANVLFFDARPASKDVQTKEVWVYDYRTNVHHTLKSNPLKESDLADFVKCYNPENRHKRTETWSEATPEGRWRKFTYAEIIEREGTNLDFKWLKEETDSVEDVSLDDLMSELNGYSKDLAQAVANLNTITGDIPRD
ncbi:MAG: class I SAM-dependent DNA methyltransferase [bacterium]|nr:class I SAM-dependent DNA methyltransferase [bacterium]